MMPPIRPRSRLAIAPSVLAAAGLWGVGGVVPQSAASPPPADVLPAIAIVINPEARVAVAMDGPLPPIQCEREVTLDVNVRNQAATTGRLQAHLVDLIPSGARVILERTALSGVSEERRRFTIWVPATGPWELAIQFGLLGEAPELGERGVLYLLVRCKRDQSSAKAQ